MQGLTHLLRDLNELQGELTPGQGGKVDTLLKRSAMFTRNFAIAEYSDAESEGIEGADSVQVSDTVDVDTAVIAAQSDEILFVEFGTGINLNEGSNSRVAGENGFSPATWSMSHSQWLLPPKSVQFRGKWPIPGTYGQGTKTYKTKDGIKTTKGNLWTEGHRAVDGMYHSFNALLTKWQEFAKDIFR